MRHYINMDVLEEVDLDCDANKSILGLVYRIICASIQKKYARHEFGSLNIVQSCTVPYKATRQTLTIHFDLIVEGDKKDVDKLHSFIAERCKGINLLMNESKGVMGDGPELMITLLPIDSREVKEYDNKREIAIEAVRNLGIEGVEDAVIAMYPGEGGEDTDVPYVIEKEKKPGPADKILRGYA